MGERGDELVLVDESDARDAFVAQKEQHLHRSPLFLVSQEPLLNDLVARLSKCREEIERAPNNPHQIVLSNAELRECRAAFDRMIRKGEESLHRLCELFCKTFVGEYQLQSVVIGETPTTQERFTLTQILSRQDLYSTMDLDLGSRQLRKLRYFDGGEWVSPTLVANMVEYQPTEPNEFGVQKIISRIKAEEELWNKVVDEIFGLDALVARDKELRHLSYYVKDIFGVKVVVGTPSDVIRLHNALIELRWDARRLGEVGQSLSEKVTHLEFLETKDYLHRAEKKSGWEAVKSVVLWGEKLFEIQVQPLANFWREREHLTKESHAGFKSRREEVRQQVANQIPLFGFYQTLLKWLFQYPDSPIPTFPGVKVVLTD